MRRISRQSNAAPDLRLVSSMPETEPLSKETEALCAILDRTVSYERLLCRDSVGGERPSETIRFKVSLSIADRNPLSEHIARKRLHAFLVQNLGAPLSEFGTQGERLISALQEAEDAHLIHLKRVR